MARYRRSTWIDAPIEEVWTHHSHIEGLLAVTPAWFHLRVDAVRNASGQSVDPESELLEGFEIDLSVRPGGIGPAQSWTSRIAAREGLTDGPAGESGEPATAMFCDRMLEGPMAHWEHTHRFEAVDRGTKMTDTIEYRVPPGRLGAALSGLAVVGLAPAFWDRHRRTRENFEKPPNEKS